MDQQSLNRARRDPRGAAWAEVLCSGWTVVGGAISNGEVLVQVDGAFESDAERERVLGDMCRRLNARLAS